MWWSPATIYLDYMIIDKDVKVYTNSEMYIEILKGLNSGITYFDTTDVYICTSVTDRQTLTHTVNSHRNTLACHTCRVILLEQYYSNPWKTLQCLTISTLPVYKTFNICFL